MYKCVCGEVFNEYTADWKTHDEMACPECFSKDYEYAKKCKKCGEFFAESEGESYICNTCFEDYSFLCRHNPKAMYEFSEGITEKVEINDFLASRFTVEEIEEILLKELILSCSTGAQDYIDYINRDKMQFAEWIEEVIENEQTEGRQKHC